MIRIYRKNPSIPKIKWIIKKKKKDPNVEKKEQDDRKIKIVKNELLWRYILIIFSFSLLALAFLFYNFPPMSVEQKARLKRPSNIEDVKVIGLILSNYTNEYYYTVMLGYSFTYIILQSFCIPGSIFLSFLGGSLFGLKVGVVLVCFLSANGASGAYFISYLVGRKFLEKYFPDKSKFFGEQVKKHRVNLFNYFLSMRFSPLLPNWFVNIASAVFHVPFHIFWFGTFIGVAPQTFIAVKAGLTLQEITSAQEIVDWRAFVTLLLLMFLALVPTLKPVQTFANKILKTKNE